MYCHKLLFVFIALFLSLSGHTETPLHTKVEEVAPGVYRIRAGVPETFVPSVFKPMTQNEALARMPRTEPAIPEIAAWKMARGCRIELSLKPGEVIYGLGLQCKELIQNGVRKVLKTAPGDDSRGAGHAPVPLYVSTAGYGILIDNARHVTFSVGAKQRLRKNDDLERVAGIERNVTDVAQLYGGEGRGRTSVYIDIPAAEGVDIYYFAGPRMGDAIARYNLCSGGGFIPPMSALAPEFLIGTMLDEEAALKTCKDFAADGIPISSIGLEPGWQTHAYSSSYIWNRQNFSEDFVEKVGRLGYGVTLWCQLYLDPSSPLVPALNGRFGDFDVWRGFVPDMADGEIRRIYRDFLTENFIDAGIAGFKLDEVDGSHNEPAYCDWMFPEFAAFPSGAEGDQMRNLFGLSGQKAIAEAFRMKNRRTFGLVRASHAWAASMPMVLYSDEYNFADYVRYNLSAAFSGVLWSPEVRHADNERDWARRLAASALSAKMVINNWQFPHPAWQQPNLTENERGNLLPKDNWYLHIAQRFTRLRAALIPYLYTAYYNYYRQGTPPVRPLVADYPEDVESQLVDDQWLLGEALLVAPVTDENSFTDYTVSVPTPETFHADAGVEASITDTGLRLSLPKSGAGLIGGQLFVKLKQGKARLRFLAKGDTPMVSTRLRQVLNGKVMQDMGVLYKDNVLTAREEWTAYSFDFDVPADGEYALVLSKGYSYEAEQGAGIEFRNLRVEQLFGNPQTSWQRMVYLPAGGWYDLWTGTRYEGGQRMVLTATAERPLVFVKENTLLPLAVPKLIYDADTVYQIRLIAYGEAPHPCVLYADDGTTFDYEQGEFTRIEISAKGKVTHTGTFTPERYKIEEKGNSSPELLEELLSNR